MIEFVESEHLYLWDGVITPSVTQIVGAVLGNQYSTVPPAVLQAKAQYGTELHRLCEEYMTTGQMNPPVEDSDMLPSYMQFIQIVDDMQIKPVKTETIVGYQHKVCGRFDLLANVEGKKTLIDYKTTARYNAEYLSIQETLYAMAIEETLNIAVDQLACIWLPKKRKAQYKTVDWYGTNRIERILADYEEYFAE